jgi:DNA polymerase-3 subunit epsilon
VRQALLVAHSRGEPVGLAELARALLAAPGPVPSALARRVVAAALEAPPESLSDPLAPAALARAGGVVDLETPLEAADWVVVDLETTGLSRRGATILEIGAVRISGLALADRFASLVHPGRPIPRAITALTGIDDAAVAGAPPLSDALPRFLAWLGQTPGAPFVAHNAAFDHGFVAAALADHALPPLDAPVLCTKLLGRRLVPELRRFGLDPLTRHFGIDFGEGAGGRHRALGDAWATAELLLRLLALAREQAGVATLGDLVALQAAPARRPARTAVAPRHDGVSNRGDDGPARVTLR